MLSFVLINWGIATTALSINTYICDRKEKKKNEKTEVFREFLAVINFISDYGNSPPASDEKRMEILKMCRLADQRYREFIGPLEQEKSCEALAAKITRER
jgi:hypothetical protein